MIRQTLIAWSRDLAARVKTDDFVAPEHDNVKLHERLASHFFATYLDLFKPTYHEPFLLWLLRAIRSDSLEAKYASTDWLREEYAFWKSVADNFSHPIVHALMADCLSGMGKTEEALSALMKGIAHQPKLAALIPQEDVERFRRVDRQHWARFRVAILEGRLLSKGDLDDAVREDYSELLDDYADDPEVLDLVKSLGPSIEKAVADGRLPRAFVLRQST